MELPTSSDSSSSDSTPTRYPSDPIKGPWSAEEDRVLTRLVQKHGPKNWSLISRHIKGRSGKSCRLRWCNQLSPDIHHCPFSPDEDATILAAHAAYGNRWAAIARLLPGRTDNAVKNHWNSTLKRMQGKGNLRMELEGVDDPVTALTLAPPGSTEHNSKQLKQLVQTTAWDPQTVREDEGFWDMMRGVIAREVKEYVTTSFGETSGFH